jgi:ComF family protein
LPKALLTGIQSVSTQLFNLVFPDECRLCERPLENFSRIPVCPMCLGLPRGLEAQFLCRGCRTPFVDHYPLDEEDLCEACRENSVNFDAVYAFGSYEGPLRKLVHLFKYGKVESLAGPLSRLLVRAMPENGRFDVMIAMPMHWRKRWERGFNQAELLARPVAKRFGMKLSNNLRRKRYTKSQAGLSEIERRENLKNSFSVKRPEEMAGKRVLLIDDVFTTGETLRSAAAALKSAGAAQVCALTLARVDRGSFPTNVSLSGISARALSAGSGVN